MWCLVMLLICEGQRPPQENLATHAHHETPAHGSRTEFDHGCLTVLPESPSTHHDCYLIKKALLYTHDRS